MPAIADAAAQARLLARRGADAAAVVIGASFHPVRTVRGGAQLVQGLMNPPARPTPGARVTPTEPPAEAQQPAAKKSTGGPAKKSTGGPAKKAPAKKAPAKKTPPGAKTAPKAPAPPEPDAAVSAPADVPVEPTGPAPHIPPRIAGEVERDYGDDLPGIKSWED